ncbi:ATP-binding cassette domain-containing protein [Streptomyces sp. NPDC001652]|uniref:ATP-binding cassette domain-containing protein n=1 Tax=Streptomyces sp. NPDC001652 TaxID=3154393 RepID=UPI0033232546
MKMTVDQRRITLDRTPILRAAHLAADKGGIVGLVGPNGSGKSTALRTVCHSLRPADTEIDDREAVAEAVPRCGVGPFADRDHATLSGGERQRVLPARARPAASVSGPGPGRTHHHLDIRARFELLDLVRSTGVTTLAVLHDLGLAARLRDHLVVLRGVVRLTCAAQPLAHEQHAARRS